MFDSPALETMIALGTLFLVFSVVASAICEAIGSWQQWRGRFLQRAIGTLLDKKVDPTPAQATSTISESKGSHPPKDQSDEKPSVWERVWAFWTASGYERGPMTKEFYGTVAVQALRKGDRLPSYIPPVVFANEIIERVARQSGGDAVKGAPTASVLQAFEVSLSQATGDHTVESAPGNSPKKKAGKQKKSKGAPKDTELVGPGIAVDPLPKALAIELSRVWERAKERPLESGRDWATQRVEHLREEITTWYDRTMERAKGWYKRHLHVALLVTGAVMACAMNIDVLAVSKELFHDASLRSSVTGKTELILEQLSEANALGDSEPTASTTTPSPKSAAGSAKRTDGSEAGEPGDESPPTTPGGAETIETPTPTETKPPTESSPAGASANEEESPPSKQAVAKRILNELHGAGRLPIGWTEEARAQIETPVDFATKLLGLALCAFAISLGAPFWFDVLSKIVSLRSTGTQEKTSAAASEASTPTGATDGTAAPQPIVAAALLAALPDNYWDLRMADAASLTLVAEPGAYRNIALMGRLAELAYRAKQPIEGILDPNRVGATEFEFYDKNGTQAFSFQLPDSNVRVVSFRGTEPKQVQDLVADAKFALREKPFPLVGGDAIQARVHRGFWDALDLIWKDVAAKIDGADQVWFTGHSLGGALATVAALRAREKFPADRLRLVTFGSPRVGDATFADQFTDDDRDAGISTYRYINGEDIVTRVPPRVAGYKHVGRIRYFQENGLLRNGVQEWWRFLNSALSASEDFKRTAKTTVVEHSMAFYVQRLDSYAGGA